MQVSLPAVLLVEVGNEIVCVPSLGHAQKQRPFRPITPATRDDSHALRNSYAYWIGKPLSISYGAWGVMKLLGEMMNYPGVARFPPRMAQ